MANDDEVQQSDEIKSTSKIDDDEQQLVAGRKPADKVGGKRVVERNSHRTSSTSEPNLEDVTGLTNPPNITPNPDSVSGAPDIGNAAFSTKAARVAQQIEKPAQHVRPHNTVHHINQPSKH